MQNLPRWVWIFVGGMTLGTSLALGIVFSIFSDKNIPNPPVTFPPSTTPPSSNKDSTNEDKIIIVRDSKYSPLENVSVTIETKQGLLEDKTLSDGSYRFQVPQQELQEVYDVLCEHIQQRREPLEEKLRRVLRFGIRSDTFWSMNDV